MSTTRPQTKLARVPLTESWQHEVGPLTPWRAETDNPNALANTHRLSEFVRMDCAANYPK